MKKKCLSVIIIAVVSTLLMFCSSCSLRVQAVKAIEKLFEKREIPYSNVAMNGKQVQIELTSDSTGRCSKQDVKNLMFAFHTLQSSDANGSFDEVQIKITDNNGELIYHTIQRVSFSHIQRIPHSIEKIDNTCKIIKEQITKTGIESTCQYSIDTVLDVPRINFTLIYNACDPPSFDVNDLYDLIISDTSQNYNIGYCTLTIKCSNTDEDYLYLEGDSDLNLLFAWISPELSSRIGPPTENQLDQ